jgi:hypothetical protein
MILTLAALLTTLPAGVTASSRPPAVRVYVFTATSPGATEASEQVQGRSDSVRDLEEVLRRKRQFVLVPSADQAQVVVEVVNREERDAPQGGFGGKAITPFRETIVRLRVTAGQEDGELKGVGQASWKAAAKDAANRLSKWVKSHRLAL